MSIGNYVALVFPKFLLNTPEFAKTREYLSEEAVECIIDFGEKGFPGVLVETLAIFINTQGCPLKTNVFSFTHGIRLEQAQDYIFDKKLPYWIIYRDAEFDSVCKQLDFNVFKVFRDRQITNKLLSDAGDIRVLKSRNISDDGKDVIDIDGYDSYISYNEARSLSVFEYLHREDVYLTPNMTYKPRVMRKPKDTLVNGSLAIEDDGISVISCNGISYKNYLEIAKKTNKKICVITDNDGKQNRIAEATTFNKTNTLQHIFLGTTTDDWTWEACLYNLNKTALDGMIEVQAGADYLFHKKDYGQVLGKMLNNKVETAYKMLLSKMAFVVPQYIKDAIKWLRE